MTSAHPERTDAHRRQLSEFLKNCRQRLTPEELGLPSGGRRRTPGLRREDVAALAGVSVTWYTWLEQGRDIQVSAKVLDQICLTLRLSPGEREYLYSLAQRRPAPPLATDDIEVSDTLRRLIDAVEFPALVMTERWDVLASNIVNDTVFLDWTNRPAGQRNLFKVLMENVEYPQTPEVYAATAASIVPKFRVDYSQAANVESFEELVDELMETCEAFREHWDAPEYEFNRAGIDETQNPQFQGVKFEFSTYIPEGHPLLRVMFNVPLDADGAEKFRSIAREHRLRD
ncbi:MAG: helix-turn-helix transcriptional regulator [Gammaproteobacteria bacterium]|jgi:transcriptional regulator with XRE-family HTH domain